MKKRVQVPVLCFRCCGTDAPAVKGSCDWRAAVRAHTELGSACPGTPSLRGCLRKLPVCILRQILKIPAWLLQLWGFVTASGLPCFALSVCTQSCLQSQPCCLEVCHHRFVMSLMSPSFECCIPAPSAEAVLARVQWAGWAALWLGSV